MDVISFINDCIVEDIDTAVTKRHGIDSIRQWSKFRPYNITISLKFQNRTGHGIYKIVLSSVKGSYRVVEEMGDWTSLIPRRHASEKDEGTEDDLSPLSVSSSFLRTSEGNVLTTNIEQNDKADGIIRVNAADLFLSTIRLRMGMAGFGMFRSMINEISSFCKYSIYPNTLREPQVISRARLLQEDGSNLATVLKYVNSTNKNRQSKENLISALRLVMPILSDILVRSAGGYYVPVVRVSDANNSDFHDFNLSQISDGTLRVLGLLTAFYQPVAPNKIAVEEPEQMIHPGALSIIAEAAKDFADDHNHTGLAANQVFITTHSPTLLDLFDPEQIIWTTNRNGSTECGNVSQRHLEIIKAQLFLPSEILVSEGFFK